MKNSQALINTLAVAIVAILVFVLVLTGCPGDCGNETVVGDKVKHGSAYVTSDHGNKWQRQIDSLELELSFMTRIADSRSQLIRCYAGFINEHCDSFPVCGAGI